MSPRLALVDWGIGGFSVRLALRRLAPALPVLYWSDTGAAPYGTLSRRALASRLAAVVDACAARGASRVFLACNAASSVLAPGARFALPVEGIVRDGVECVVRSGARRVGVIGGARTIRSGVYREALRARGIEPSQRIAQPLSAAIEAGRAHAPETERLIRGIVAPLARTDAVLLACTHYPASRALFERALPQVAWLDPAEHAARRILDASGELSAPGEDRLVTSGAPEAMRRAARSAWGLELGAIDRAEP